MKPLFLLLLVLPFAAWAGSRTSANYTVETDTIDGGGGQSSSANYSCNTSNGLIAGLASVATPAEIAKTGFIGQLYEVTTLHVSADPATINERASRQLSAEAIMDDDTAMALDPDLVGWSETSPALTGISSGGLVTAASVYQDQAATVQGSFQGVADPDGFGLTVLNITDDDFESYAADGIDDDWQVGYFGLPPNSNAAPSADPDGDQQNNEFEFLSGFSPTDPAARFMLTVEKVESLPGSALVDLKINRQLPDRVYTLKSSTDLVTPFVSLGILSEVTEPKNDVLIHMPVGSDRSFFLIEIFKP